MPIVPAVLIVLVGGRHLVLLMAFRKLVTRYCVMVMVIVRRVSWRGRVHKWLRYINGASLWGPAPHEFRDLDYRDGSDRDDERQHAVGGQERTDLEDRLGVRNMVPRLGWPRPRQK